MSNSMQRNLLKSNNYNINKVNKVNILYKRKDPAMNDYIYNNKNISFRNNENIYNLKPNYANKNDLDSSDGTSMEDIPKKRQKNPKINYSFNILEAILVSFFNCCLPKKLNSKNNINEKANSILFKKLDLVTYVRSMILSDLINDIILSEDKMTILNFLSRPVISLNKDPEYPKLGFYKKYRRNDFEKYFESISDLVKNSKKEFEEKKLISLSNKQLKYLV